MRGKAEFDRHSIYVLRSVAGLPESSRTCRRHILALRRVAMRRDANDIRVRRARERAFRPARRHAGPTPENQRMPAYQQRARACTCEEATPSNRFSIWMAILSVLVIESIGILLFFAPLFFIRIIVIIDLFQLINSINCNES